MPRYDYKCDCGFVEEQSRPVGAKVLKCPECGKRTFRQQFPTRFSVVTEREFARSMATLDRQFKGRKKDLGRLIANARAKGIAVSPSDSYEPSIASRALDPMAIVPHDRPREHIKEVSRRRNIPCNGMVHYTPVEKDPVPYTGPPLAEDVTKSLMRNEIKRDPGLAKSKKKLKKLREDVINRHAAPAV